MSSSRASKNRSFWANSTVIEARALPEEGASVMAGTQVTFFASSVVPVTFSVASSPAQLASPDIDQGLAQPLPSEGIHVQGFTSSKAASAPGIVYWQASFSAAEVPGCAGILSGLITSPVRRLTVSPQPSPLPTPVISATTTTTAPAAIELELNSIGRALLSADHGRLSVNLMILKSSPSPSQTHNDNVQLVLRKTGKTK
jgi:hypothetical protein